MYKIFCNFIRLTINALKEDNVSDEVKESFEDFLVSGLKKNDVVSVYSGSFFVLCSDRGKDEYEKIAHELIDGWKKNDEYKDYEVSYEIECIGE